MAEGGCIGVTESHCDFLHGQPGRFQIFRGEIVPNVFNQFQVAGFFCGELALNRPRCHVQALGDFLKACDLVR